jgi:tetratricopeptide (TPR) repeat protein
LSLAAPLLLLGLVEAGCRLGGFGGYAPVLRRVGEVEGGQLVISDQAGAVTWFFANPDRPGYCDQYAFLDPKPAGVFRVFLLGESAAKGYPQPPNLASSAFLKAMLSDAWPDRQVEVINLGTTAVASFPVRAMLKEVMQFEPDLVIIHTGHNEFFGAYGVASINRAGSSVAMLQLTRAVRSLALVQALSQWLHPQDAQKGLTLMEIMVGQSYTAPDDPLRQAAARNLGQNLRAMAGMCRERGVPAIICTLPSNERDLLPIGEDRTASLPSIEQARLDQLLDEAEAGIATHPSQALERIEEGLRSSGPHARLRHLHGQALFALGRTNEAQTEFARARDLDSMPWRATSLQQTAIRQAAESGAALLCDLEGLFRQESPGGCIGWELLDDHVHPTLRGQALMAEGMVKTLAGAPGRAGLDAAALERIRPWPDYARRLGENAYDDYGVAHSMRVLFSIPFMQTRNPKGFLRFQSAASAFEENLSPELKTVVREWQSEKPHAGGKRPITGMVAREFMRQQRYAEALTLYEIATRSVPLYTSWHMEYVYFTLVCREKLTGALSESDRELARAEIEQGRFLLRRGFSQTGLTERYMGRLHQLRGEFAESIPYLNASRQKLGGTDLVAADQALFLSLLKTGRVEEARKLAQYGVEHSGQYAPLYRQMLDLLNQQRQDAAPGNQDPPGLSR